MRVYLSGALMAAKSIEAARALYERTAELLSASGFRVYLPHRHTDPANDQDITYDGVFLRDREALVSSDLVVAFLDEPSLGVGAEVALALCNGRPVLGVHLADRRVSRFLLGLIESDPLGRRVVYSEISELVDRVREFVTSLSVGDIS
jgi:nucleoside 2-deoxyribosyltransferase